MNIKIDNEEVHSPKEGQAVRGVQAQKRNASRRLRLWGFV